MSNDAEWISATSEQKDTIARIALRSGYAVMREIKLGSEEAENKVHATMLRALIAIRKAENDEYGKLQLLHPSKQLHSLWLDAAHILATACACVAENDDIEKYEPYSVSSAWVVSFSEILNALEAEGRAQSAADFMGSPLSLVEVYAKDLLSRIEQRAMENEA